MSTSFRRNVRPTVVDADAFINGAKTAVALDEGRAGEATPPSTTPAQPTEAQNARALLNPRIMRQVNIEVPETLHFDLRELVDTMPRMSMRKFILEAIDEKMARVRAGQGA